MFVDGDGTTGLNHDTGQHAQNPVLEEFNSKLYATWWEENSSSIYQIRVVEWDGNQTWNFVDGGSTDGINRNIGYEAYNCRFLAWNSKLYITWNEQNTSSIKQIRVAEWDGNQTWNFIDGCGADGINKSVANQTGYPFIAAHDSTLFASWQEFSPSSQIRIAEWDGSQTWNFVDGNSTTGINYDTSKPAGSQRMISFNSKLYITWFENVAENATRSRLIAFSGTLFVAWKEYTGSYFQIRVAKAEVE